MVNKVRVNIAGTPYAIATTDSEKYIQSLAKKLDEDITKLLDENENLSVTKAAVFCAMDYLDEYRKSTGSAENMRSQIQDYIADAARAKLAEAYHAERYLDAYNTIDTPTDDKYYLCPICGYIHKGENFTACPICLAPKASFKEY
mgnify:CR=1 FL=1